jgi:hypothetical protein
MARPKSVEKRLATLTAQSEAAVNVFRAVASNLEQAASSLFEVKDAAYEESQRQAQIATDATRAALQAQERASAVRGLIGE